MTIDWVVLVPAKRLDGAKTRLSTRPAGIRRDLALAFVLDTVAAALDCARVAAVHVVSDDSRVHAAVVAAGAVWTDDVPPDGLNDALRYAEKVARSGTDAVSLAALAGDLPAVTADELDRALSAAEAHPRAFVADAAGTGTTLLTARSGVDLHPLFGPRSCAAHAASGAVRLEPGTVPGLRRDVDTEVDLWDALRLGVGSATAAVLGTSP